MRPKLLTSAVIVIAAIGVALAWRINPKANPRVQEPKKREIKVLVKQLETEPKGVPVDIIQETATSSAPNVLDDVTFVVRNNSGKPISAVAVTTKGAVEVEKALRNSLGVVLQAQSPNPSPQPGDQQTRDFSTPLMRAAYAGRVDEVGALLKSGIDVNEKDVLGCTALTLAVVKGNIDVAKLLLQAGADPNAAGGVAHVGFCSVMIFAMTPRPRRLELIDMLIAAGGKLNPPHSFPHSPLMSAVQFKDIDLINALLERGADVNWANSIGATALQDAVITREPNIEVIRLLLNTGADPNKTRFEVGNACISLLQALDEPLMLHNQTNRQIGDLLRRAGAKKYKRQSRGRSCYE